MEAHKILIFGDGRHLFRTIRWVLEYKGYHVSLAPGPEAALALLIEQNYDLVIAKLRMEDLQSLDVLKRAKKLNPGVSIVVVSGDGMAAFPLEAYQIDVDDYLLLPINPGELMRRLDQCLKKVEDLKQAKARGAKVNQELVSRIMLMFHDIRGSMVSIAASLKLLKRGKYGAIASQATNELQELYDQIKNSIDLIDVFAQEMLRGHGQRAASNRSTDVHSALLKFVPQNRIPEARQSAKTMGELS